MDVVGSWRRCGGWRESRRTTGRSTASSSGSTGGFRARRATAGAPAYVDRIDNSGQGWEQRARHAVDSTASGESRAVDASRTASRCASTRSRRRRRRGRCGWSTSARGADADFAGKDIKGAVVLGDAPVGRLWTRAVRDRGAAGVISTTSPPTRSRSRRRMSCSGEAFPLTKRGGRSASRRRRARRAAARRARRRAGARARRHRHGISPRPNRTLVAEIPGRDAPTNASCSSRTCRSRAPTITPAASARCSPPPWPSATRSRSG